MPASHIADSVLEALRTVVGPAGWIDRSPDIDPYLVDFRQLYRGQSPLVLLPSTTGEVALIVRICAEHGVGIVPHGGNTSYCGGATPDESRKQIVLSLERLKRIRKIDALDYTMTVEAGCVLAQVQAAAEEAGRLFPLSLGSEGSCQIGGTLATNAGGTAVLRYGMMRDLALGLEVVLADGQIWDGLTALRKNNSGYDLKNLFIGSEGTLGIITAACLKLFPLPLERATALAAVAGPAAAVELLSQLRAASGDSVTTFELMPRLAIELTLRHIGGLHDPFEHAYPWYVLVELTSSNAASGLETVLTKVLAEAAQKNSSDSASTDNERAGNAVSGSLVYDAVLASSSQQREALWRMRESIPEAQRHAGASIKHDISVPIASIAEFVRRASAWVETNVPDGEVIAYGHLGDGNLHFNIQQRAGSNTESFLQRAPVIHRTIYDLVADYRGSFSAEHGIGRLKIPELLRYKSAAELSAMRAIKLALDPKGILNPGKVLGSQ